MHLAHTLLRRTHRHARSTPPARTPHTSFDAASHLLRAYIIHTHARAHTRAHSPTHSHSHSPSSHTLLSALHCTRCLAHAPRTHPHARQRRHTRPHQRQPCAYAHPRARVAPRRNHCTTHTQRTALHTVDCSCTHLCTADPSTRARPLFFRIASRATRVPRRCVLIRSSAARGGTRCHCTSHAIASHALHTIAHTPSHLMCALGNHARSFDAVFCRAFTCLSRGFVQTHDSRGCEMAPFDDRSARNTHIRHARYSHCSSSTMRYTWPPRPPFVRRCRIDSQAGC